MSTARANRPTRDKHGKSANTDKTKSDMLQSNKNQTAERGDKNKGEDPEVLAKIEQVQELTGATDDDALFALHDVNYDLNRAVEKLLERSENSQNEWQTISKKEKSQPAPKPEPIVNNIKPESKREKSKDREFIDKNENSGPRNRRDRGPPRFQRGRGRDRGGMDDDRGRMENNMGGERHFDRSERGGRGRGRGGGPGRGRGRGRSERPDRSDRQDRQDRPDRPDRPDRNFRGARFDSNKDQGPHIDTWTNAQAEAGAEKENIGSWGDMATEDWSTEDWQGSLEETQVFTAKSSETSSLVKNHAPNHVPNHANNIFSSPMNDNDAKMFSAPVSVEAQVFSATSLPNSSVSQTLNDSTNTFQHGGSPLQQNSMSPGTIGQHNSLGQSALGQSSLGQRLDISALFPKTVENSSMRSHPQQNQYMSQFAKEATESIKNAVGIGSSAAGQQAAVGMPQTNDAGRNMAPPSGQPSNQQVVNPPQQRSAKAPRTKLPPPSKIPASAVEMPGSMNFNLDVQFGNWDLTTENSNSNNLGFGTVISSGSPNNYTASSPRSNSNSVLVTSVAPTKPQPTSMPVLDALSQNTSQSQHSAGTVYQTPTNTTPPKDYTQSISQNASISTPPDQIPFPSSPNERKSSPYSGQRGGPTTGSMSSNKPVTTPLTYSQSSYSSSYASSYKPAMTSAPTFHNSANGLSSGGLSHQSPSQYNSSGSYQSSSFQNQSGFSSSPAQNSLYQGSSNQSSAYSAQSSGVTSYSAGTGSGSSYQGQSTYSNQSNSSYPSQSYSARESSQSASSAYPSAGVSQSGGSGYQSSIVSQTGNSYQSGTVSQSANSGYSTNVVSQSGSSGYPSSAVNQSPGTGYPSSAVSQSASSYQSSMNQSNVTAASHSYPRDNQSMPSNHVNYNHQSYAAQNSINQNAMSSSKLSDSMGKMSMQDSSLNVQSSSPYDHPSNSTSTVSMTTMTTTTSTSLAGGNVSVASSLGLSSATTTAINAMAKNTLPHTSKGPPNLPPGVPLIQNYMTIGQPGLAPFAFASMAAAQQPLYSYEDLQLLQQRLPLPGYSYDMPLQPTSTLPTRDQSAAMAQVPYSAAGATENKMTRVDAQSPVNAQPTQQQSASALQQQQQAFINPSQLPPGYNYYYPTGGVLPGGYSYQPTVFPVSVTNTAHGGTTPSGVQFQKPSAFGSHAYGAGQTQDFSKAYSGTSGQNKVSSGSIVTSTTADLTGTGTSYGKPHTQSYDKAGYHAGTPPPFNMSLPTGTQAGPMGGPTAYGAPYVPVMAHQPHSQMLHHQLQQDSSVVPGRSSQQSATQNKAPVGKTFSTYWGPN